MALSRKGPVMQITNNGKGRVFKMNSIDAETPEAAALWADMYKAQKREDLAKRGVRLSFGAKHRELITPKWELDKHLRVIVQGASTKDGVAKSGRTEVPDLFYPFIKKITVGEIEIGAMSITAPVVPPKKKSATPKIAPKKEKVAERKSKTDE